MHLLTYLLNYTIIPMAPSPDYKLGASDSGHRHSPKKWSGSWTKSSERMGVGWRLGLMLAHWCRSTNLLHIEPASTGTSDRLRAGKPPRYVTSHPAELNLAIPSWMAAVSISEREHRAMHFSSMSVVSQHKPMCG